MMFQLKRFLPLLCVMLVLLGLWALFSIWPWTLSDIAPYEAYLLSMVQDHFLCSSLVFFGVYVITALLALPFAVLLSVLAGYLFGQPFALIYVVLAASVGSLLFYYWFSHYSLRIQRYLKKIVVIQEVLKKGAFRYLLLLRLIPMFPFWLINIAAALFRVGANVFFFATLVGIIPGSFAFTQIGVGLQQLMGYEHIGFFDVFNRPMITGLVALVALIVVSFFFKPNDTILPKDKQDQDFDEFDD